MPVLVQEPKINPRKIRVEIKKSGVAKNYGNGFWPNIFQIIRPEGL
jgi:hypothetical protein